MNGGFSKCVAQNALNGARSTTFSLQPFQGEGSLGASTKQLHAVLLGADDKVFQSQK